MQIQIDSREKAKAITKILAEFERRNIQSFVSKLYVGDYMSLDNPRLVVDRKQNLSEVYANLCHDKKRFAAEAERASAAGIRLIILCEHGGKIKTLDDVAQWQNPQLKKNPYAWDGKCLRHNMRIFEKRYGIRFTFCDKNSTGRRIIELLNGDYR